MPTRALVTLTALATAFTTRLAAQAAERAAIDRFLTNHLAEIPIPGFSAVVVKDGKVLLQKGYGVEVVGRTKPMTAQSPVAIGSQTKSLTAIAIMRLVEAGKVDLDAPVTRYLPWFRTGDNRGGEVTVRMLLHNTSGIPSADRGLYSQDTDEGAIEREVRSLSLVPLVRAPGASFEYANENWTVAGAVISAVSGKPYSQFMDEAVLGPLGMTHSTTALARFGSINALWGHHALVNGVEPAGPRFLASAAPAGSELRASAEDMGRFLLTLLSNGMTPRGRFLSEQSIATLYKAGSVTRVSMPEMGVLDGESGYGMGWVINQVDGRTLIHHGGDAVVMGSWTAIDTATKTAASILYGGPSPDPYRYPTRIWVVNNLLHLANGQPPTDFGRPKEADPTANTFELPREQLDRYVGTYLSADGHRLEIAPGTNGDLESSIDAGAVRYRHRLDFASEATAVLRNITGSAVINFLRTPSGQVTGATGGLPGGAFRKRTTAEAARVVESRSPSGAITIELPKHWQVVWRGELFAGRDPSDSLSVVSGGIDAATQAAPAGAWERTETIGRHQWIRTVWSVGSGSGARQAVQLVTTVNGRKLVLTGQSRGGRLTALLRDVVVPMAENVEVSLPLGAAMPGR